MPNYQDGKIYKIVCNVTNQCYIGSTCEPRLARRLARHIKDYKQWKLGNRSSISSFFIIERGDYQILLIEKYPCESKDELHSKEGEIIREYKLHSECVNCYIAGRTHSKYREDNKEILKEKAKIYNEKNKEIRSEKSKEKFTCICGSCIQKSAKSRHCGTEKHQDYLKTIKIKS